MSSIGFHRLIARLGVIAGMPFAIHPHMLRHATGFALANRGVNTRYATPNWRRVDSRTFGGISGKDPTVVGRSGEQLLPQIFSW
jgi:hypothetical protein